MLRTRPVRRRALLLTLIALSLTSCGKKDDALAGSGVQARKTRNVPAFKRLWVGGVLVVRVSVGKDGPMELKGDDNLLEHVTSRLENGVLKLDVDTKVKKRMPLEVTLSTAELEAVSAVVASRVDVQGVKAKAFEAKAGGAAHITATGSAETLTVTATGAAQVDLSALPAAAATVRMEQAGTAKFGYLEKLDVTASGPSRVFYQGDPQLKKEIRKPARLVQGGS